MKILFSTMILFSLFSCSNRKPPESKDENAINLNFHLFDKSFNENNYSSSGQLLCMKKTTQFYAYDAINGDKITDSVISYTYYDYDDANNIISEKEYDYPRNKNSHVQRETMRVYRNSLLLTEKEFEKEVLLRSRSHIYNNENKELETTLFRRTPPEDFQTNDFQTLDRYGFDTLIQKNEYNKNGELVKTYTYSGSGRLKSISEKFYENGHLKQYLTKGTNGDTIDNTIYKKDDTLVLSVSNFYIINSIDSTWKKGELIYKSRLYDKATKKIYKSTYYYDKFGNEIESITEVNTP